MAQKDCEELVEVIVDNIMKAKDVNDFRTIDEYLDTIGCASHFATEKSEIKSDYKKYYIDENDTFYKSKKELNEDVNKIADEKVSDLLNLIGKDEKVRIKTEDLYNLLLQRLTSRLGDSTEIWDTAKIIQAAGGLLYWNNASSEMEEIIQIAESIKNKKQRRFAIICARRYVEQPDVYDFLGFFRLDDEV